MRELARPRRRHARWRGAVAVAALVGAGVVAVAPPAAANAVTEGFEAPNAQTTLGPVGATRDCTTAHEGSCSLKLDPPCCSQVARATTTVGASLAGEVRDVTFWLYAESLTGDVDSDVVLTLDHGEVVLHPTGGNNSNLVVHTDQPSSYRDSGPWSPAGVWHKVGLRLDASANTVTVSFNDAVRTATAIHPDAAFLSTIAFTGVRWGATGTPVRYDDLSVSGSAPPPPPTPVVGDDYEAAYPRTTYNGATRDCSTAQAGSCSLNLDPPCCSAGISAETRTDVMLPARVSFWISSDSLGGNVDSDVVLNLDTGPIRLHPTDGANNALSLFAKTSATQFATWSPAGQWHQVTIDLDPVTDKATASLNGVSARVDIEQNATRLDSVSFNGIRWGWGSSIRYDSFAVAAQAAPNQVPTATLVEPAADAVLPYLTTSRKHVVRVSATDPENDRWTARVVIKRARTGFVVHDVTTPLRDSGATYQMEIDKLDAGAYRWSVVPTDEKGALGRAVEQWFDVRPMTFAEGVYAGLGDSYSSGEGAAVTGPAPFFRDVYEEGTDVEGVNECHRSALSYPRRVSTDPGMPSQGMEFRACSGAVTNNLWLTGQNGEESQFLGLSDETTLVTMSIGGNDSGFVPVLRGCLVSNLDNCEDEYEEYVARRFARLDADRGASVPRLDTAVDTQDPRLQDVQPLSEVFHLLRWAAPRARVLVLGYPRFFRADPNGAFCETLGPNEQLWMNAKVRQINDIIEARALERGFEYVDVENALTGHETCTDDPWMNGIAVGNDWTSESFHPNEHGHAAEAEIVRSVIANPPTERVSVCPGCRTSIGRTVPGGQKRLTAAIRWPGGDVALSLRSPSGRRITRDTIAPDVERQFDRGRPYDVVTVKDPEPGTWIVELEADDVSVGWSADLSLTWQPAPNSAPTPVIGLTYDGVSTVSVDASSSRDVDGRIVEYLWDWGDGSPIRGGASAAHLYQPGTYTITLQVRDDYGGWATSTRAVTVHGYTFGGFVSPTTKLPPAFNSATPGKSVKFSYRVTLHDGTPVTDRLHFLRAVWTPVRCDGVASTPAYSTLNNAGPSPKTAGEWEYTWTVPSEWRRDTCVRLELELADRVTGVSAKRYLLYAVK